MQKFRVISIDNEIYMYNYIIYFPKLFGIKFMNLIRACKVLDVCYLKIILLLCAEAEARDWRVKELEYYLLS